MSRWHNGTCQSPDVYIAGDSIPCCRGCGSSAATMLQSMEQTASNPFLPPPPDEPTGKMNLTWPPTVRYVRIQPDGKAVEIERPSPRDEDRLLEQASTSTVSGDTRHQSQVAMQSSPTYEVALAPDEFRLICLSAVDNESTSHLLHLNLEVYQDHNCPDYEATSYTWGGEDNDSELCHPIYIGDYWDILLQTKNSWAMLQYLRPKRGIRLVWVDAICINQNDTTERDNQVAKMGQIYSQCSQVVVWLGSDLVLQTPGVYPRRYRLSELRDLASLRLLNQEEGHTLPQQKLNIARLLERRYFSRVWVIQELILAPRLIIPIGDMVFWADAATLMNQEIVTNWSLEGTKAPWFEHLARGSFRVDSFLELMALTSKSQATDDRDRLFGVLGLYEKKEGEFALRPDYSLSFQHVFVGFFAYYIVNQQKFQLLSKATGVSQGRSSLTWMPEWRSR
ncbi:HET-domain-containing protein, partial [Stipitochalara longipes BDJ]